MICPAGVGSNPATGCDVAWTGWYSNPFLPYLSAWFWYHWHPKLGTWTPSCVACTGWLLDKYGTGQFGLAHDWASAYTPTCSSRQFAGLHWFLMYFLVLCFCYTTINKVENEGTLHLAWLTRGKNLRLAYFCHTYNFSIDWLIVVPRPKSCM